MHPEFSDARTRKAYLAGTHRSCDPRQTVENYRRFMPMMGITRLANVTGLDRIGLPVCIAVRPNSRALATSQGKGETLDAARASALMESIETWHAERIEAPLCYDSWASLGRRARVADVNRLAVRADSTFCIDRPLHWIEGEDLMSGQRTWLPFDTVALNFVRQPGHKATFLESSNGLASGNRPVEALIHALCEVIERDAVSLWEAVPPARRRERQLDLASVTDPALAAVIASMAAKGVVLAAWDITSDIGVPTYTCSCVEDPESPHWRPVAIGAGHGTHLVPEIALSRAIHEALQSRLTTITGSRDDLFPADYVKVGNRDDHARLISSIRLPGPALTFDPARPPLSDYFEDDLQTILQRLRSAGLESALAVDLTRPEVGIPVFKVVVPGLEPFMTQLYRPGERARRLMREMQQ